VGRFRSGRRSKINAFGIEYTGKAGFSASDFSWGGLSAAESHG
jgi:hypothetical protein